MEKLDNDRFFLWLIGAFMHMADYLLHVANNFRPFFGGMLFGIRQGVTLVTGMKKQNPAGGIKIIQLVLIDSF